MISREIRQNEIAKDQKDKTVFVRHIDESVQEPIIDYSHRDNYYTFIVGEKGLAEILIDFEKITIHEGDLLCILPEQVHHPLNYENATGWIVAVDAMHVKDMYKSILNRSLLLRNKTPINGPKVSDLTTLLLLIRKYINYENNAQNKLVISDLTSSFIGIFVSLYNRDTSVQLSDRASTIYFEFRELLLKKYMTLTSPSQYASAMNISPIYLNESVKETTGLTTSRHIKNEILLQAKRLLVYTNLSIKEIAIKVGQSDWAYFSRFFKKETSMSPSQFREKYLKESN
jgi:AraC family transcriptional regulator, transcriptional activator of pobA